MNNKSLLRLSILYPFAFVCVLWIVKACEIYFDFKLYFLGILPRTIPGLVGIFTSPLVHSGYDHLLSNTLPLLVVGTGLIYFYREISAYVIGMVWLFANFWVWIFARPNWHIGASGLIYGFVCFLFLSGVLRGDRRLLAISLLVTFLYGSMVWGILPVSQTISWEAHLAGSVAGIFAAIYYRKLGPQRVVHVWPEEPEPTGPEYWMTEEQKKKFEPQDPGETHVHYIFRENEKDQDK